MSKERGVNNVYYDMMRTISHLCAYQLPSTVDVMSMGLRYILIIS